MPKFNTNSPDVRFGDGAGRISSVLGLIFSANPTIESFTAAEYVDPPLVQERLAGIENSPIFKKGVKMRQETLLPFWDSVLAQALQGSMNAHEIVDAALFHNDQPEASHRIEAVNAEKHLDNLLSDEWRGSTLALSSRVTLSDERRRHIPMLDFHIPANEVAYATVVKCLNSLAVGKFAIVDSGKSFHAYGMSLLDASGLRDFLSRALLLSPIVDTRYIAHQLRDKQCKLRVAATPRKPTAPRVLGIT
jgi:hypothetical protein